MFAFSLPIRASTPRCFARSRLSQRPHFDPDLGSRLIGRLGLECSKLSVSVDWGKIDLAASMGAGCFKVAKKSDRGLKVEFDSGGQDFFDADAVEASAGGAPEHLVIMVNGMVGSAEDWRYAAEQFVKKLPDKVIVHRSQCNSSKLTFDGVDMMGERLAEEVLGVIRHRPGVCKISFIAHSLGGLVARYAIGRLYEEPSQSELCTAIRDCPREEQSNHQMDVLEPHEAKVAVLEPHEAKVAGLEPMNFITVASPHLGSRGHKQLPFLCGLPFLERKAPEAAHLIVGRSGKHLFLTDGDDGKPPLLLQMVNDSKDLKFLSALRAFKRRVAYANVNYDQVVGWGTSSIRRQHELPKSSLLVKDARYPHIVYVEKETPENFQRRASSLVTDKKIDLEGWEEAVELSNRLIGGKRAH
ncbi:putative lipase ROG1 isoform X2 [Rhodamnia argentea]|uniref:Lipase ROG1 isoform X2 n=1 Tax=Rhodamnia argentea TaxID=178133 RepID=A0ABM3HC62_9MYRT|nr:putative lipase ROG1 isoform X2 [Rhodamnia argentea]